MEPLSEQELRSPEAPYPPTRRHPIQDAALGLGIFLLVLGVFFAVQSYVFVQRIFALEPSLSGQSIDFSILEDPAFRSIVEAYSMNGDVIAQAGLWSGIAGLALLLLLVWAWQRGRTGDLLGMKQPTLRATLTWVGVFVLLGAALEALAWFFPQFHTEFMAQVMATSTDRLGLVLGVGIVAPVFEEFLLRGLAYGSLRYVMDTHYAIAITAGLFTIMHLQYEVLVMLLILPIGVVLGYARARSGSIWVAVLLHMINNLASIFLPT